MSDTLRSSGTTTIVCDNNSVKKSILYIAIVISAIVGFLGGIIYSSIQSDTNVPIAKVRPAAQAPQNAPQGLTPQQASKLMALSQKVTKTPEDAAAWTELGNVYFDTGQFNQAINAYEKSIKLRPGNANVLTDLGVMYRRSGQPDKAIKSFEQASAVDPSNTQAKFNKGIVFLYDKGDATAAIKIWEDLLKENPGAMAGNGRSIADFINEAKKSAK
jgi:cytochrome c-type biogenesis protein CcmH/NrfG